MLTSLIADLFMLGLVLGVVVTAFFIYLNSKDAKEQNRSLFDQYRRARRYAEAIQYRKQRTQDRKVKKLKVEVKPKVLSPQESADHSEIMAPYKATARN